MKKATPNKLNEPAAPVIPAPPGPSCPAPASPKPDPRSLNRAPEPFISKHELARRLHIAPRTVERWQRRGILPFIKCGRFVFYNWSAVLAHIEGSSRICKQEEPLLRIPIIGTAGDGPTKEKP